ncbi:MAG: diacylglycerol kinase [Chitinophagaceae bacterium]|nr:diacylglycerol kinase [Anaerolineae bacterium]
MLKEKRTPKITPVKSTNSKTASTIDNSLIGTMKIDPTEYKAVEKNRNDILRAKYALAGLLYLLRHERSIRNLLMTSVLVMGLVFWLQVDLEQSLLVFLSLGLVWATESVNTALEAVVDLVTQEIHPMAKVAKDVAASATLSATITSAIITLVLLGPPLLHRISLIIG